MHIHMHMHTHMHTHMHMHIARATQQVEQAEQLYAESRREELEQGTVPPPPVPPPPPPSRAVLAPLDPRCHQLLCLLWARGAAR